MLTLIAAAALAAQPAVPANANGQPTQMQGMEMSQSDHSKMGQMADIKDCCCKDMMAKMHDGHGSEHSEHGAHQQ